MYDNADDRVSSAQMVKGAASQLNKASAAAGTFSAIRARIAESLERVHQINERATNVADGVFGAQPNEPSNGARNHTTGAAYGGQMADVDEGLDALNDALLRLNSTVDRLTRMI